MRSRRWCRVVLLDQDQVAGGIVRACLTLVDRTVVVIVAGLEHEMACGVPRIDRDHIDRAVAAVIG